MGHGAANYASIVRAKAGKARRGRHLQNRLARSPVFVEFGEPNLRQFGDLCMLDLCHRHGCPTFEIVFGGVCSLPRVRCFGFLCIPKT
ncbi:hypothetical protein V9T40_010600 [Parthenolecanium corni]|uniref:Uncharacterized protein n=1 Tax=Parthenolecanium corni TaxID=536013 RepID=A0AAN9T587_9HEMI